MSAPDVKGLCQGTPGGVISVESNRYKKMLNRKELMEIHSGKKIKLTGKTRRGKNRVSRHGNIYTIEYVSDSGHVRLASLNETFGVAGSRTKWMHWVQTPIDNDFLLEKPKKEEE